MSKRADAIDVLGGLPPAVIAAALAGRTVHALANVWASDLRTREAFLVGKEWTTYQNPGVMQR